MREVRTETPELETARIPSGIACVETRGVKRLNPYGVQGRAAYLRTCGVPLELVSNDKPREITARDRIPLIELPPVDQKSHPKGGSFVCY